MDNGLTALSRAQLIAARDAYLASGDAGSAALFTAELNARYIKLAGVGALVAFALWVVTK